MSTGESSPQLGDRAWETDMEKWRIKNHHQLEHWKATNEHGLLILRSQFDFALAALRGTTFSNGGAAVALLALMGHVISQEGTDSPYLQPLALPMLWFTAGVFLGVFASAMAYLSQAAFSDLGAVRLGTGFQIAGIFSVLAGLVSFGVGVITAVTAFGLDLPF